MSPRQRKSRNNVLSAIQDLRSGRTLGQTDRKTDSVFSTPAASEGLHDRMDCLTWDFNPFRWDSCLSQQVDNHGADIHPEGPRNVKRSHRRNKGGNPIPQIVEKRSHSYSLARTKCNVHDPRSESATLNYHQNHRSDYERMLGQELDVLIQDGMEVYVNMSRVRDRKGAFVKIVWVIFFRKPSYGSIPFSSYPQAHLRSLNAELCCVIIFPLKSHRSSHCEGRVCAGSSRSAQWVFCGNKNDVIVYDPQKYDIWMVYLHFVKDW
jgi:hypothetical protein